MSTQRTSPPTARGDDPIASPDPTCSDHIGTASPSASDEVPISSSWYVANEAMTDVHAVASATEGHHLLYQTDELDAGVPRPIAFRLYTSHFLSTWNSRLFEFGAALFLTAVYPGTLLPVSIYSLVRNAGYIVLAQPLGKWINNGNRLSIIRTSIIGQRVPVAASCALLLVLELKRGGLGYKTENGIFAAVVLLAVVEKLCSTMNTISVERDWVSWKRFH